MISMTKKDYELILEHAKSCVPEEACGLIAGVKNGDDKEIKNEENERETKKPEIKSRVSFFVDKIKDKRKEKREER